MRASLEAPLILKRPHADQCACKRFRQALRSRGATLSECAQSRLTHYAKHVEMSCRDDCFILPSSHGDLATSTI